jgi:predicted branched-subunit amino acid permease
MENGNTDPGSRIGPRELWNSVGTPAKIGLLFAIIAALMALMGWVMRPNYISRSLISLFLAIAISAVTWGVVSWAIAAAAMEVTKDEE